MLRSEALRRHGTRAPGSPMSITVDRSCKRSPMAAASPLIRLAQVLKAASQAGDRTLTDGVTGERTCNFDDN